MSYMQTRFSLSSGTSTSTSTLVPRTCTSIEAHAVQTDMSPGHDLRGGQQNHI